MIMHLLRYTLCILYLCQHVVESYVSGLSGWSAGHPLTELVWCDICSFSGVISMKFITNIRRVNGEKQNVLQVRYQTEVKVVGSPLWELCECDICLVTVGNFDETCHRYSLCWREELKRLSRLEGQRSRSSALCLSKRWIEKVFTGVRCQGH